MTDIVNCVVDTKEMALSVDGVSQNISNTTAAVIAMQAAVIASEKVAADTICQNVDKGFLTLMQSQISTKKAQYLSALNAHMMKLMELSKALQSKEERMEDDVARLQRQHYKIFHNLDHALENRVRQLDTTAMNLADARKNLITVPQLRDIVTVTESENESRNTAQMAVTARIRSKTSRALTSVGNNVAENEQYRKEVDGVLEEKQIAESEPESIPIVYAVESSMVMPGSSVSQVYLSENISKASRDAITNQTMEAGETITAVPRSDYEKNEVTREFRNMTSSSNLNSKVTDLMLQLFEKGAF